jgi:hypothetical protein
MRILTLYILISTVIFNTKMLKNINICYAINVIDIVLVVTGNYHDNKVGNNIH